MNGLEPAHVEGENFGGWRFGPWDSAPNTVEAVRAAFERWPDAPFIVVQHHDRNGQRWRHVIDLRSGSVDQIATYHSMRAMP